MAGEQGLDWQTIDVKFTKGVDTKTQKKLVAPGSWNRLENLTLDRDYTLRPRDGVQTYATNGSTATNGLAVYNGELLAIGGNTAATVDTVIHPTAGYASSQVAVSGQLGTMEITKTQVYRSSSVQQNLDCCVGVSAIAYVWDEVASVSPYARTGVHVMLRDYNSGAVIFNATYPSYCNPRVVEVFSPTPVFYVFCLDTALGIVNCLVITDTTSALPTAGAMTPLANYTKPNNNAIFLDAATGPNSGSGAAGALVVAGRGDGTTSLQGIQVQHSGTTPSVVTTLNLVSEAQQPKANYACASVAPNNVNHQIGCFSWGGAGLWGAVVSCTTAPWSISTAALQLDATGSALVGGGNSKTAAIWSSASGQYNVFTDFSARIGTANISPLRKTTCAAALTGISTSTLINSATFSAGATVASGPQGPFIAGKPYTFGTTVLLPVYVFENYVSGLPASSTDNTTNLNLQNSFYIMDCGTGVILAKANYGSTGTTSQASSTIPSGATPCTSNAITVDTAIVLAPERTGVSLVAGFAAGSTINASPSNICSLAYRLNTSTPPVTAQIGQSLFVAGGSLSTYDGIGCVEHGFYLFPEGVGVTVTAGASGVTVGSHQFVVVYEWIDNAGQRHQSAPSIPQTPSLTFTAGNLVATLHIPTLQMTQKPDARIVVYMTQANGTIFYRVNTYAGNIVVGGLLNDKTSAFITTTIASSDAEIGANEILYTQPTQGNAVLPNSSPPPCKALAVHQGRLFTDVSDNPFAFRYSQQLTTTPAGPVGLQFNESLGGVLDSTSGGIVAISTLDEKVIFLCQRKLYVVYGTGPNSTGSYNNYSDPQLIPTDVGCTERNSVLKMPNGIIFKTPNGWYLLGRDLTVKDISNAVQAYDGNSVSGALLLEDRQQCRFTSRQGPTLVYSYDIGEWSTLSYSTVDVNLISAAAWWPTVGALMMATVSAGLLKETPGVFVDQIGSGPATPYPRTAVLSFLHLQTLSGFQRVRWLYLTASALSSPTTTLNIGVDYNDSYGNTSEGSYSIGVDLSTIAFTNLDSIDLRHKLRRQKCKSVAFTFTEIGSAGNTFLSGLQALTLQAGMKRGTNKLPAAQGVG